MYLPTTMNAYQIATKYGRHCAFCVYQDKTNRGVEVFAMPSAPSFISSPVGSRTDVVFVSEGNTIFSLVSRCPGCHAIIHDLPAKPAYHIISTVCIIAIIIGVLIVAFGLIGILYY